MQPTGFLCSLPDYRPTMAALSAYKKINAITSSTHMIANFLGAGAIISMIAGRSVNRSILPTGAVKFFQSGQTGENISSHDFILLQQSFAALGKLQKKLIYSVTIEALNNQAISSDDKKILLCIHNSAR